jgi:nucleotide-binding universal stress UspA family protein
MPPKIIVSYDGTDNDRDALALGALLKRAGASLELAYVRHLREAKETAERLAESDAATLLAAGAKELGEPDVPRHVVLSSSTPAGLRDLAVQVQADVLAFGSAYRTAPGSVDPQPSARQLLDGGPVAIAIAPAGFAHVGEYAVSTIASVAEDGDPCPGETAEALATRLGATVAARGTGGGDLVIVGSKTGTVTGRVTISAAAEYLIELARSPVIVLPRGVALSFG